MILGFFNIRKSSLKRHDTAALCGVIVVVMLFLCCHDDCVGVGGRLVVEVWRFVVEMGLGARWPYQSHYGRNLVFVVGQHHTAWEEHMSFTHLSSKCDKRVG